MTKTPRPKKPPPTHADVLRELAALDLHPAGLAAQRTDALLRNLLATPPDPHVAPKPAKKPAKRAKK